MFLTFFSFPVFCKLMLLFLLTREMEKKQREEADPRFLCTCLESPLWLGDRHLAVFCMKMSMIFFPSSLLVLQPTWHLFEELKFSRSSLVKDRMIWYHSNFGIVTYLSDMPCKLWPVREQAFFVTNTVQPLILLIPFELLEICVWKVTFAKIVTE